MSADTSLDPSEGDSAVLALLVICSSILLVLLVTYVAIKVIRPAEFTFRASIMRVFSLSLNMRLPEATPPPEEEPSAASGLSEGAPE